MSDDQTGCYLGDGVYVEWEGGMIKLTTEDGVRTTNVIYLEPEVFANLELAKKSRWRAHSVDNLGGFSIIATTTGSVR